MTLIQWFRDRLGLDSRLTQDQLYSEMLKRAATLASKGKVTITMGGYRSLEEQMFDPQNYVFILTVHGKKIKRPRDVRKWFKDYKI